ncbi:MAG: hypothetical protein ACREOO_12230 [bacterium]
MKFGQFLFTLSLGPLVPSLLHAQDYSPWTLSAEGGTYSIHHDATGIASSLRLASGWKSPAVFDIGIVQGFGEDYFTTFDAGFEVHLPFPTYKFTPFAGIGAGLIYEPKFSEVLAQIRIILGAEFNLSERMSIRISRQIRRHLVDDGDGPSTYMLGLVYHFAKKNRSRTQSGDEYNRRLN